MYWHIDSKKCCNTSCTHHWRSKAKDWHFPDHFLIFIFLQQQNKKQTLACDNVQRRVKVQQSLFSFSFFFLLSVWQVPHANKNFCVTVSVEMSPSVMWGNMWSQDCNISTELRKPVFHLIPTKLLNNNNSAPCEPHRWSSTLWCFIAKKKK